MITKDKRKQINDLVLKKYGEKDYKLWLNGELLINDKEISDITGIVTYKIPVGKKSFKKVLKDFFKIKNYFEYKTFEIKPKYNFEHNKSEDFFIPVK